MKPKKERGSFRKAPELTEHASRAIGYLKEVRAACDIGDKPAAQRALRQAIIELETARAGLHAGMD